VILEALLDVRDIVLSDGDEVLHLRSALARVDRDTSIATWPRAEPPAMTEWRQGVLQRAARSDVAAAILHALEPYHALIRRADPSRPVVVLHLPADRVTAVRQRAVMSAWCEQMEQMVARDGVELGEWLRYCITAHSSAGTQEDMMAWEQRVIRRAEADSEAAGPRASNPSSKRDRAMAALAADAARPACFRGPRARRRTVNLHRPRHRSPVPHVEYPPRGAGCERARRPRGQLVVNVLRRASREGPRGDRAARPA
jgi:hypothetical protein